MRYVDYAGTAISVIGLGTWQFGSRAWGYGREFLNRDSLAITRRALDLGINMIDTAEIYGLGRSERAVGRAIADRRDQAFVATKLYPVAPFAPLVASAARRSAARLSVEQIDLYQMHAPNPIVPIETTMRGMAALLRDKVSRHIGVSNFSLAEWQTAESALGRPITSNQVRFSLVARQPEPELLGWAQSHGRILIAYSPLGQGLLSGRYDADHRPGNHRRRDPKFTPAGITAATPLLTALKQVARDHGATPAQVALAWVIRHPNVIAIAGASSVAQLESNAVAADLVLTDEEDERLSDASDRLRLPPRRPTAGRILRSAARAVAGRVRPVS